MQDVRDLMQNASYQVQQRRQRVQREFWSEIKQIDDGEDAQTVIQQDEEMQDPE